MWDGNVGRSCLCGGTQKICFAGHSFKLTSSSGGRPCRPLKSCGCISVGSLQRLRMFLHYGLGLNAFFFFLANYKGPFPFKKSVSCSKERNHICPVILWSWHSSLRSLYSLLSLSSFFYRYLGCSWSLYWRVAGLQISRLVLRHCPSLGISINFHGQRVSWSTVSIYVLRIKSNHL